MTNLKEVIGDVLNLAFVSDQHPTITNVVEAIFPTSYHRLCTYHLSKNLETQFKDQAVNKFLIMQQERITSPSSKDIGSKI